MDSTTDHFTAWTPATVSAFQSSQVLTTAVMVFPCAAGGKQPLTTHGFQDASSDPAQVTAWWRRWPDANLGMPTGRPSRVDIDVYPVGSGFAALSKPAPVDTSTAGRGWSGLHPAVPRFGANEDLGGDSGGEDSSPPSPCGGKTREQASTMVCGRPGFQRYEQISALKQITNDPVQPANVCELARRELAAFDSGEASTRLTPR